MATAMEVGDIWAKDLRALYEDVTMSLEHWLILKVEKFSDRQVVEYLHLETGRKCDKVFSRVVLDTLDFSGNPYYKKVA